jgi:hypothetical protein
MKKSTIKSIIKEVFNDEFENDEPNITFSRINYGDFPDRRPIPKYNVNYQTTIDGRPINIKGQIIATQQWEFEITTSNAPEAQEYFDNNWERIEKEVINKIDKSSGRSINELDHKKLYSKVDPWDTQRHLIDYYPTSITLLDDVIKDAESFSDRGRFLMTDAELEEYKKMLYHIRDIFKKIKAGEPLNDFEKKLVRYYKTRKDQQKSRIHNYSRKKIIDDYKNNFDPQPFKKFIGTPFKFEFDGREYENATGSEIFFHEERYDFLMIMFSLETSEIGEHYIGAYYDGGYGLFDKDKEIMWAGVYGGDELYQLGYEVRRAIHSIFPQREY